MCTHTHTHTQIKYGYVSHSFNQFITTDGSTLLAADHGDAYPRSVSLIKYNKAAGNDTFTDIYGSCDYVEVFPIQGSTGNNDTGVAVGGLVVSDSSYLIAGNSVLQDNTYNALSSTRNIFVTSGNFPLHFFARTADTNTAQINMVFF